MVQGRNSVDQRQRATRRRGTLDNLCYTPPKSATQARSMFTFGKQSKQRLLGIHPNLVHVVERALELSPVDFMVVEGFRTLARQQELYAQGRTTPGKIVTWTMKSKHLTGSAVDIAPVDASGTILWGDVQAFDQMAAAMFAAAKELDIAIRHGGDWDGDGNLRERGESDSPHFELVEAT